MSERDRECLQVRRVAGAGGTPRELVLDRPGEALASLARQRVELGGQTPPAGQLAQALEQASRVRDPSGRRLDLLDPKTLEVVFDFLDPEIEVREDPRFPEAGIFTGKVAVRRYFDQFTESFDEFSFETEDFIDLGVDRVLM